MLFSDSQPDPLRTALPWQHPFSELGAAFSISAPPTPLPQPYWVAQSDLVAQLLHLPSGWQRSAHWLEAMTGNTALENSQAQASVYSGHQFGVWAGQLGDGRAILLGQLHGWEVQLKGAGRTPFSRMGDGRAVLRSSIREFLACEAMHGLQIPTTRALCVTGSLAPVQRETAETAAVLCRSAPSFLRFGHFEHFSYGGTAQSLQTLADYVIERYYPACQWAPGGAGNRYAALLAAVSQASARLVAQWQAVGFCHGVLNTDNMSMLGLTLDYGPLQFLDGFDPGHICNHSDPQGRYAYDQQPGVVRWNLYCLGQALLPLIGSTELALQALQPFESEFSAAYRQAMADKLGADSASSGLDPLLADLLALLARERVDYPIFWRRLSHWARQQAPNDRSVHDLFLDTTGIDAWLGAYVQALGPGDWGQRSQRMLAKNPKYVLRNHVAERAIQAAREGNFAVLSQVLRALETPYQEHPEAEFLADFPPDWAAQIQVSCSS